MTIKLPKKTILDKILRLFNKEREIEINSNAHEKFAPHVTIKAKPKSFFKTLFGK